MGYLALKADSLVLKCGSCLPDNLYLRLRFFFRMGYRLNLTSPKSYSEKLQWLKLYDRKPLYTDLVDKYEVKSFVENLIGEQYLANTFFTGCPS